MSAYVIYKDNDSIISIGDVDTGLGGLKNAATGLYLNSATVTLTSIKDSTGTVVAGETFPKTMTYVAASNGIYQVSVDKALALVAGAYYTAYIDATYAGIDGHWEVPLRCLVRT